MNVQLMAIDPVVGFIADRLPADPMTRSASLAEMRDFVADVVTVFDRPAHSDLREAEWPTYDRFRRVQAALDLVALCDGPAASDRR